MDVKRRQGRPKRGDEEVGVRHILDRARQAMRERPFDLSSRKELSDAVSVTPALISYYFPKGANIADLVLSPVIFSHKLKRDEILRSAASPTARAINAASHLIHALGRDKVLFDAYLAMINGPAPPDADLIQEMHNSIAHLMQECAELGIADLFPLTVRHGAFWGMCLAAAELQGTFDVQDLQPLFTPKAIPRTHAREIAGVTAE